MQNRSEIEINKIYCEDCLETMARMPDGFVDYTLTSPPYNIGGKYNNYKDNINYYFEQQKSIINELLRVTKNHKFT